MLDSVRDWREHPPIGLAAGGASLALYLVGASLDNGAGFGVSLAGGLGGGAAWVSVVEESWEGAGTRGRIALAVGGVLAFVATFTLFFGPPYYAAFTVFSNDSGG